MRIKDYLFLSIQHLLTKKVRTFLTSLGITIGVATIFVLISLSQGLKFAIEDMVSTLGQKVVILYPGTRIGFTSPITGYLSNSFIQNIKKLPGVERVLPIYYYPTRFYYQDQIGTGILYVMNVNDVPYLKYYNLNLEKGTWISNNNQCQVNIGYGISTKSIDNKILDLGDYIIIFGQKCQIVGIFQQTGSPILDNLIVFPEGYYKKINGNINYNYLIIITNDFNLTYNALENYINNIKGQNFVILTAQTIANQINSVLSALTIFSLIIASISIIISSINILNTMYTSVLERYQEIGLLKALGMEDKQILFLFLLESGIIGLVGGMFGIVFGLILANLAVYAFKYMGFPSFHPYISIELIVFSLIFPFVVGIISGLIPAIKASRVDPIEALKYE
ncbi:MAG: ABC transporter permease [Nanopusillaceae archaeon]